MLIIDFGNSSAIPNKQNELKYPTIDQTRVQNVNIEVQASSVPSFWTRVRGLDPRHD